jgi:hypothetical protein
MRITVELLRITVDAGLVGYQKIAESEAHPKQSETGEGNY